MSLSPERAQQIDLQVRASCARSSLPLGLAAPLQPSLERLGRDTMHTPDLLGSP